MVIWNLIKLLVCIKILNINMTTITEDHDEQTNFKTSLRRIKVRGHTQLETKPLRAKKLQGLDSDFHVFVGQVGYWLPWIPVDKIEDESFINTT